MQTRAAYALSVIASSFALTLGFNGRMPSEADPDVILFVLIEVAIAAIAITTITFAPYLLARSLAKKWPLPSGFLYVPLGVGLGWVGALLQANVASYLLVGDPERLPLWVAVVRFAPAFLGAGLVGGLTYWIARERLGRSRDAGPESD